MQEQVRIDHEEIDRVAKLAHLSLTEDERREFCTDLTIMLEYLDQILRVEVEGLPDPDEDRTATPLREDVPYPGLSLGDAVSSGPDVPDGRERFFRVPRIIRD